MFDWNDSIFHLGFSHHSCIYRLRWRVLWRKIALVASVNKTMAYKMLALDELIGCEWVTNASWSCFIFDIVVFALLAQLKAIYVKSTVIKRFATTKTGCSRLNGYFKWHYISICCFYDVILIIFSIEFFALVPFYSVRPLTVLLCTQWDVDKVAP